jgi:hypothetical protein
VVNAGCQKLVFLGAGGSMEIGGVYGFVPNVRTNARKLRMKGGENIKLSIAL